MTSSWSSTLKLLLVALAMGVSGCVVEVEDDDLSDWDYEEELDPAELGIDASAVRVDASPLAGEAWSQVRPGLEEMEPDPEPWKMPGDID